jgi:hypothetical protein
MFTDTVADMAAEAGLFSVAFLTHPATFPETVAVPAAIAVPVQPIAAARTPLHINRDFDLRNTSYSPNDKVF